METRFARAILETVKLREESFNQSAAKKAQGSDKGFVDYEKFYMKPLYEAADEAASNAGFDKRMTQPIYLLVKLAWNDIQDWADRRISEDK